MSPDNKDRRLLFADKNFLTKQNYIKFSLKGDGTYNS